jgi:hypothetical protein
MAIFFVTLINEVLGGLLSSCSIIKQEARGNHVLNNSVKQHKRCVSVLNILNVLKNFCFTRYGNDKPVHQTFHQSFCINYLLTKAFIALAYHNGISCFKSCFINTTNHNCQHIIEVGRNHPDAVGLFILQT